MGLPNARVNPTMPLGGRLRCLELLGRATGVRNEIIFAYVHGSFLSGPYRDIDVAVYLSADMRRVDRFDYEAQLAAALSESVGQPVDVQVLNSAPLGVQHAVLNGQAIFVRDDEVRCAFFEDVARRHMDFDYLSRQFMMDVLER